MLAVAAGGLAVNLVSVWMLHGGHETNLNVRGAWLHVVTDALEKANRRHPDLGVRVGTGSTVAVDCVCDLFVVVADSALGPGADGE